jgi:N-methylhydantoinase B
LSTGAALDAITLEIIWSRLISVTNEQQAALVRTGFSTVLRESEDLACGVFDSRGFMVAQSVGGAPGHINSMATGVRHLLAAFPEHTLEPGDALISNDPWQTAGQVNDITVLSPVFHHGRVVAYFASTCHSPDIGGRPLSAEAADVFEEGLRIPTMKLVRAGELNRDLIAIIRENVRTPDETVGDIYAQLSSNEVGAASLLVLLDEFGLPSLDVVADEVVDRSERAMRAAIADVPDGDYEFEAWSDGIDEPLRLCVKASVRGDEIAVDYAGTSPQTHHGINVVLNYTHAYTSFALKALLAPDVPHNEGSFRPVRVTAPEGSLLNCLPPAPVASRHLIGLLLPGVIFGALAPALPDRVLAGGSESLWIAVFHGQRPEPPAFFSQTLFHAGGTGARAERDGLDATCFPSGVAAVPTEVVEMLTPLVVRRRALREGSGGAGRTRGGLGQVIEVANRSGLPWSLSAMIERIRFAPRGLHGGRDGAFGELLLADGTELPGKRRIVLDPGAVVRMSLPGGGGRGEPSERDPGRVLADVVDGYITIEQARELYGVDVVYDGPPGRLVHRPEWYRLA